MFRPIDPAVGAAHVDVDIDVGTSSLNRSMANWQRELQTVCDQSDALLKPAAETLRRLVTDFYARKAAVLSRMVLFEGEQRAAQMRALGLDDMVPTDLRQILVLAGNGPASRTNPQTVPSTADNRKSDDVMDYESTQERAETAPVNRQAQEPSTASFTPAVVQRPGRSLSNHLPVSGKKPTRRQPELARRQSTMSAFLAPKSSPSAGQVAIPSAAYRPDILSHEPQDIKPTVVQSAVEQQVIPPAAFRPMPAPRQSQSIQPAAVPSVFPAVPSLASAPMAMPHGHLQPKRPPISSWEVQGDEFIFQHHLLGPGWFVLRCDRGSDLRAVTFRAHPFHNRRAWNHFNTGGCKYHDRWRTYTDEDLLEHFARRVVDSNDENFTDDWAQQSNEMIEEKKKKHKTSRPRPRRTIEDSMEPDS
ncbi:hypothetical protein CMQ_7445 [Grosmannia clavigera kw1407]|uniref:Uncharacterized protein n=1 Tax=Grosmannia clavigera (strain kw1407 / UAMH 11150) TaxID=655863 RepID=F0XP14_GROCL|nr:uncharacterized protein CMQ_7445 [Grosmannia clavigera kw1407]EFX00443.1 hypothetical protein CMQ_7445 [Grosmannia clavigera kw1407]